MNEIERLIEQRNKFLGDFPHLAEIQRELDRKMLNSDPSDPLGRLKIVLKELNLQWENLERESNNLKELLNDKK